MTANLNRFQGIKVSKFMTWKKKEHGKLNGNWMGCCLVINLKVHIYEVEYIGS